MPYIIDGPEDFFASLPDLDTSQYVEGVDYHVSQEATTWFPDCPELLAIRNASITEAWACPKRRAAQAVSSRLTNRNAEPEINAKRSAARKAHPNKSELGRNAVAVRWAKPGAREANGARIKAMWAAKRAAKAALDA